MFKKIDWFLRWGIELCHMGELFFCYSIQVWSSCNDFFCVCVQGIVWQWQLCETAVGVKFVKKLSMIHHLKLIVSISHISRDVQCVTWMKHLSLDNCCLIRIQELQLFIISEKDMFLWMVNWKFCLKHPTWIRKVKNRWHSYGLCFKKCKTHEYLKLVW